MRDFVQPGDVVTFSNGMIGTITKAFRIALIDKTGCLVSTKYMPFFLDYQDKANTWPVKLEESHKVVDADGNDTTEFFVAWFDEAFYPLPSQRRGWKFVEDFYGDLNATKIAA